MIYLIEYKRSAGKLVREPIEFAERDRATAQAIRLQKELAEAGNLDSEILLLEAATIDDLKNNHGRYFKSIDELKLRMEQNLTSHVGPK